jgi:4-amino-4-deoxy-L-arabinose transferase-like glycosyltransferase
MKGLQSLLSKLGNRPSLVICYLALVGIAFLLRVAPLGRYVTPDEPAWVYRSVRFSDALAAGDWMAVPSTGHPGVTTMWLGAAGVAGRRLLDPKESAAHLDWIRRLAWLAPENEEAFRHLAFFLPFGRVTVALTTTLGLAILVPLLVRLFGRRVAFLAGGLLAFDPFLVGHSGLLHTDALLATFSGLSVLCLLIAVRDGSRSWVWSVTSGAAAGLALLTKSLAAPLVPFTLLVLGVAWLLRKVRFSQVVALFSLWALAGTVLYWALCPAMWAAPIQTLRDVILAPSYHAQAGLLPTFFTGRVALQHGPEFYAVALPFRLSPIVLGGLLLSVVVFVKEEPLRFDLVCQWLFALGYTLFLAFNAKKYDRYLLPILPLLASTTALGWESLSGWVMIRRGDDPHPSFARILLFLQLILALLFVFYPLTSFNPLIGGPWVAARLLPVDWGEGMGAAARWLNRLPDAERLTVAVPSIPSFAPLFEGRTVPLDQATLADYVVFGPSQLDDSSAHRPTDQPTAEITLGFLTHATVYTNTAPMEQTAYLADRVEPGDLILLDADTPLRRRYTGPGTLVSFTDLPDRATVADRLVELSAGRSRLWLVSDPAASAITAANLREVLESIADPAFTTTVASATITQYTTRNTSDVSRFARHIMFGDQLILIGTLLPVEPVNARFPISLRWQVPAPTVTDLHASLYLRDAAHHTWVEVGYPVLNDVTFPISAWNPGEWADSALTLKLPERIPPSTYAVELTITDAGGAQVGAWDADGKFQGVRVLLGEVKVAPPVEPEGIALCEEGRTIVADPFVACLPVEPLRAVPSGDVMMLSLVWSASAPPQLDYRIRWRLLDTSGSTVLEQVSELSSYVTSHWRADDSFEVNYDVRIDPELPAATYTLTLDVLDPDGRALWTKDEAVTTVEVLSRERQFELPADISHPLGLTLGDVVHLRGFDLDQTNAAPGGTLPLTLYWEADGPTDLDYTVFVHLLGPDGLVHGQVDTFPGGGVAPTSSWAAGQVVVDEIALPVAEDAPAGVYHVAVGMYEAASGGRLPIGDRGGDLLADDQAVLPIGITVAGGQP